MTVEIDDKLVERFENLPPQDLWGEPITLEKYINDLLADNILSAEEYKTNCEDLPY